MIKENPTFKLKFHCISVSITASAVHEIHSSWSKKPKPKSQVYAYKNAPIFGCEVENLNQTRKDGSILVRKHLLATLATSHTLLLLLTEFRRIQLLLLLRLDEIAHGISLLFVIVILLVETGTGTY
jgi:hypothetical protein